MERNPTAAAANAQPSNEGRPRNDQIAEALEQLAHLLAEREANPHRVRAYLNAARTAREAERPLAELLAEGGMQALKELPGIGDSLAARIAGFIETGQMQLITQLREDAAPEQLFTRVTGIGAELARRIHARLGIETLEELEMATYDGRLAQVEGFGARRIRAVRHQLGMMLNRAVRRNLRQSRREALHGPTPHRLVQPPVQLLLNIDVEYRARSEAGDLEKIAPQRFNPTGEAWLPVLHTSRGAWTCTAVFSNTARAHELDKTGDWVVIYYERDGREGQCTVVTETHGDLEGQRVVRGREDECRAYYAQLTVRAA